MPFEEEGTEPHSCMHDGRPSITQRRGENALCLPACLVRPLRTQYLIIPYFHVHALLIYVNNVCLAMPCVTKTSLAWSNASLQGKPGNNLLPIHPSK